MSLDRPVKTAGQTALASECQIPRREVILHIRMAETFTDEEKARPERWHSARSNKRGAVGDRASSFCWYESCQR